jgi:dephospho-CoA kinase
VALLCGTTGRVALQAVATPLPVVATDRLVGTFTVVLPAANPLHIWADGTTVRRALAAVVSRAAAARAAVVSLTPLLAATMTARLEPAARRSAVVLVAGTLSNLT